MAIASDDEHLTQEQVFALLERIKYPLKNPKELPPPTIEALAELNYRWMTSIPFEIFALRASKDRSIDISLQGAYDRVVNQKRGGFCLSLNRLALDLLYGLGYTVQYTLGRVCKPLRYDDPIAFLGLTHRLSIVRFADGSKYIFDIGFGTSPYKPLKIGEGAEVEYFGHRRKLVTTIHNEETPHVLDIQPEELWQVQEFMGVDDQGQEKWCPNYTFTERQYYAVDCDVGNIWCCYSSNSPFYRSLWVMLGTLDGHYHILIDRHFKIRNGQGTVKSVYIETEDQRQEILKRYFDIELTEEEWKYYDIAIEDKVERAQVPNGLSL
ncbi:N-terminal acetyltransferase [Podila humilis]|nr:N-terminal acetyltransferase [Podila humilis]